MSKLLTFTLIVLAALQAIYSMSCCGEEVYFEYYFEANQAENNNVILSPPLSYNQAFTVLRPVTTTTLVSNAQERIRFGTVQA